MKQQDVSVRRVVRRVKEVLVAFMMPTLLTPG
jgi:hypothetical protein